MAIKCELCGNTEFIKEDGMFVCKGCNTKYSLEEAKKMINGEESVSVAKETPQKLDNLYQLARRAKDENNSENAQKYYEMIVIEDPSSWEANFYSVYYQSMGCKIAGIQTAAIRVNNCEENVLNLIKTNLSEEEQKKAVEEISVNLIIISTMLFNAAKNHYDGIGYQIKANYTQEFLNNGCAARDILYNYGDLVIKHFGESFGETVAVPCWKLGIDQHCKMMTHFAQKEQNKSIIESYGEKIRKYEQGYITPAVTTTSGGCYVATAVYGSYDCPEVWTLRRYRDNTLAESIFGRAFIHTYYAISPTIVKWFGETRWFKALFKNRLDKMVKNLNDKGVKNTPYNDKMWK